MSFMPACKTKTEVKTLQIGGLWALSGWASVNDVKSSIAGQIAVDMFNERGGLIINGQKYEVELVIEDTKSTADGAVAAANVLVHDKGIKFIAGPFAFFSAAAASVCEPEKVLRSSFYNLGMPGEIGPDVPYAFCGGACSIANAIAGMEYLQKTYPDVKNIVQIEAFGAYAPETALKVEKLLGEHGISRVGDVILFPDETLDFSPFVAKVVEQDPDALYIISGMVNHVGSILKGLREAGWNKLFAISTSMSGKELMEVSGKATATNAFILNDVPGAPGTPPLLAEFQDRTMEEIGDVSIVYGFGFNSVWTLLEAIETAQSLDTTVVKETWEKLDTIETCYGTGWIGGQETYGIRHQVSHKMPVTVVDNGELKFAEWVEVHIP